MPAPAAASPASSTEFARQRDAWVCWLLGSHPVTAAMLVGLGWFPSKNKALRRLNRLTRRGRIHLVGTVCHGGGRPEHVWCRWRPKPDQLLHEVQLTRLCLRLDAGTLLRGPRVTDPEIRPDAEVWINGQHYFVELDRGTMGYAQIDRRFRLYENRPSLSLWVCSSAERLDEMRRRAERLRHTALFATLADTLASPHGDVWLDFGGGRATLPREGHQSRGNNPRE